MHSAQSPVVWVGLSGTARSLAPLSLLGAREPIHPLSAPGLGRGLTPLPGSFLSQGFPGFLQSVEAEQ